MGSDEGGGVPAMGAVLLGSVSLALALVLVSAEVRVRMARAQWAADAAALAAAADLVAGRDGGGSAARRSAVELSEANGARLVSIELLDREIDDLATGTNRPLALSPTVVVTVELDGVTARAGAGRFAVDQP